MLRRAESLGGDLKMAESTSNNERESTAADNRAATAVSARNIRSRVDSYQTDRSRLGEKFGRQLLRENLVLRPGVITSPRCCLSPNNMTSPLSAGNRRLGTAQVHGRKIISPFSVSSSRACTASGRRLDFGRVGKRAGPTEFDSGEVTQQPVSSSRTERTMLSSGLGQRVPVA